MAKRNCTFNDDWLIEFEWVEKGSSARTAYCKLCHHTFDISNMGRSALTSHSKGKKHKDKEISWKSLPVSFFAKKKSNVVSLTVSDSDQDQCPSSSSSDVQHKKQCTLPTFVLNSSVTEAEILWAIRTVLTHSSQRSCDGLSKLFVRMFSDSVIAKSFTSKRTKCSYFINFGIAPYLKELLLAKLKSSDFFVTCYDESLNRVLQEEQMEVVLRYFSNESCMVETSYFDSAFLK